VLEEVKKGECDFHVPILMRTLIALLGLGLSSLSFAVARDLRAQITNAAVVIKTHLLHGFTEDDAASGR
ncbi:hypothetical protein OAC78_08225, partial [Litorivicinus sp.]|nr:hypothetical protein [Litorivicinus sp.]